MSRVRKPEKFMNATKYPQTVTNASKIIRSKMEYTDYTKAKTLSSWLFLKYDMSYRTYRNKSKARREALREEYMQDTGNDIRTRSERAYEEGIALLMEIGVPFSPDGTPLGIGWDD